MSVMSHVNAFVVIVAKLSGVGECNTHWLTISWREVGERFAISR